MKKTYTSLKRLLLVIFIICIIISPMGIYYAINFDDICMVNTSKIYVDLYSKQLSKKDAVISNIDTATETVLTNQVFEKTFLFSNYNKEYLSEVISCGKVAGDELKQAYYNQIVMLRLKVLAIQGQSDDYNDLFFEHIYDIENNFHTSNQYVSFLVNDENHIIEWNSNLYKTIEKPFIKAIEDCEDNTIKFYLLNEIIRFYSCFDDCSKDEELYREMLGELVKENKTELSMTLNRKYEEINYK